MAIENFDNKVIEGLCGTCLYRNCKDDTCSYHEGQCSYKKNWSWQRGAWIPIPLSDKEALAQYDKVQEEKWEKARALERQKQKRKQKGKEKKTKSTEEQ